MTTLLRPEPTTAEVRPLGESEAWRPMPDCSAEQAELRGIEDTLQSVLTSLETTLPNILVALREARWEGETLCDPQSLDVLTAQVEGSRQQLTNALDSVYVEIQHRLSPPDRGYDGPAWE